MILIFPIFLKFFRNEDYFDSNFEFDYSNDNFSHKMTIQKNFSFAHCKMHYTDAEIFGYVMENCLSITIIEEIYSSAVAIPA